MNHVPMTIGKVYTLRGGHIMRYQGLYAGPDGQPKGPALAFRGPREGVSEPPVGYSAAAEDVLYEVTAANREGLEMRRDQARARNLHELVADMEFVLAELT